MLDRCDNWDPGPNTEREEIVPGTTCELWILCDARAPRLVRGAHASQQVHNSQVVPGTISSRSVLGPGSQCSQRSKIQYDLSHFVVVILSVFGATE